MLLALVYNLMELCSFSTFYLVTIGITGKLDLLLYRILKVYLYKSSRIGVEYWVVWASGECGCHLRMISVEYKTFALFIEIKTKYTKNCVSMDEKHRQKSV